MVEIFSDDLRWILSQMVLFLPYFFCVLLLTNKDACYKEKHNMRSQAANPKTGNRTPIKHQHPNKLDYLIHKYTKTIIVIICYRIYTNKIIAHKEILFNNWNKKDRRPNMQTGTLKGHATAVCHGCWFATSVFPLLAAAPVPRPPNRLRPPRIGHAHYLCLSAPVFASGSIRWSDAREGHQPIGGDA